jgi:hypothetical protein
MQTRCSQKAQQDQPVTALTATYEPEGREFESLRAHHPTVFSRKLDLSALLACRTALHCRLGLTFPAGLRRHLPEGML